MAQEIAKGRDLLREFLHGDGHIGHEVVVLIGDRGPVRSSDDALLLHDLQGLSYAVLRDVGHLGKAYEAYRLIGLHRAEYRDMALQELQGFSQIVDGIVLDAHSALS